MKRCENRPGGSNNESNEKQLSFAGMAGGCTLMGRTPMAGGGQSRLSHFGLRPCSVSVGRMEDGNYIRTHVQTFFFFFAARKWCIP